MEASKTETEAADIDRDDKMEAEEQPTVYKKEKEAAVDTPKIEKED